MPPIYWFGDREAYESSKLKVITVALNPSCLEFQGKRNSPSSTQLRFPSYKGTADSLIHSLNEYFKKNPYMSWFGSFENILNGMGVSYKSGCENTALHTDLCSPYATQAGWASLSKSDRNQLFNLGFPMWQKLVEELKPDVIISSIPQAYIKKLGIQHTRKEFMVFDKCKDGSKRKKNVVVDHYTYNDIPFIKGITRNLPFGSLSNEQKREIGIVITNKLIKQS